MQDHNNYYKMDRFNNVKCLLHNMQSCYFKLSCHVLLLALLSFLFLCL